MRTHILVVKSCFYIGLEEPLSSVRLVFRRYKAGVREVRWSEGSGWVEVCMGLLLRNLKVS